MTGNSFPRAERLIRGIKTPLGALGAAAVAAALCGMVLHPRGLVVLLGILTVIGLGLSWPYLSVRGLAAVLHFDRERAREGETVSCRLTVRNRSPWSVCGIVLRHEAADCVRTESFLGAVDCLPALRTTAVVWNFVPMCRGEYPRRAVRLASGFPFGLREVSRPVGVPSRLLVWPRTFPVGPIPEAAGRGDDGFVLRDRAGNTGDMLGVRPYRRGDSLRRIHWSQTARHAELIVCELQAHAAPHVQIVLDAHADAHAGEGPDGSLEWAIRVAASFFDEWIAQGAEIELVAQGQVFAGRRGSIPAGRARVFDGLARIEPDGLLTLTDLLELPACRGFKNGVRLVVTTDRGLRGVSERRRHNTTDLYVVLHAAAFAGPAADSDREPPAIAPWIWIDDPARVPQIVRRAWKEVAVGC